MKAPCLEFDRRYGRAGPPSLPLARPRGGGGARAKCDALGRNNKKDPPMSGSVSPKISVGVPPVQWTGEN